MVTPAVEAPTWPRLEAGPSHSQLAAAPPRLLAPIYVEADALSDVMFSNERVAGPESLRGIDAASALTRTPTLGVATVTHGWNLFEMIKALNYKLRMFRIPIRETAKVFGDNNSVVLNCSSPESTLKKKHLSINYNYVRECVAAEIGLVYKVGTDENLADLFTKVLDKVKRKKHVQTILR